MSRTNAKSRRLHRRPSRVVPAVIVAAILLALAVFTAIAAIARLATGAWPPQVSSPARFVATLSWGSALVIIAGSVMVLLGVVVLIAGVKLGGYRTATLATPDGHPAADVDYVISTRALARLAAAQADTVDGVDQVSASATGRRVMVRVATTSEDTSNIGGRVHQVVTDRLIGAGVSPAPRVNTSVRTRGI